MISNQTIQTSIDELKSITRVDLSVYDGGCNLLATTMDQREIDRNILRSFIQSPADSQVIGQSHLLKVWDEGELLFVLLAKGNEDDAYMIGKIAVSQIRNLSIAYKERYDKNNFLQNLLLDNLLLMDIHNKAKKLHIEVTKPRAIFLVETGPEHDEIVTEIMRGMFSTQAGDYITSVDESNVVLMKALSSPDGAEELKSIAEMIVSMLNAEAMVNVRVSFGNIVYDLKDVSKSYKEARMAMDVGKIFYAERRVCSYSELGIGRLIYQLPVNLCKIFIEEIFGDNVPDDLDEETLTTINKFFENNLNVSETSRQLFVHRNTLVYRIEKLQKSTGLDLRNFDDALTFKIALMVVNYMKYLDTVGY